MKTPGFWYRAQTAPAPPIERALTPLSYLYRLGYECHQRLSRSQECKAPVICVGNLNAGGSGKTPVALALMSLLQRHKATTPFFLTRGYGGCLRGPLLADPARHSAKEIGDEPLMLAAHAPVVVSADRAAGACFAAAHGANLILMDDGLQNPGLHKDIRIIVIDGAMGFGNEKMLPAGPLRQPIKQGLDQGDLFILIGEDKRNIWNRIPPGKPVFKARLEADGPLLAQTPVIAFAGIGYPEKFFNFLRTHLQAHVVQTASFGDHHPYKDREIETLLRKAREADAKLVTTPKDALRIPLHLRQDILVIDPSLVWNDPNGLENALHALLKRAAP